jgi:hypothetical protein
MRYNRYIAFGVANGGIRVTAPTIDIRKAAQEFFTEYPGTDVCSIRRVSQSFTGEIFNDPEFKVRRVSKQNA